MNAARTALAIAVLVSSVVMLGLALCAPLHTDEVTWRHILARALLEGGNYISLGPQCPSSFAVPIPASFYPGALVYTIAFSQLGLLGIKLSGIVLAAAWLIRGYRLLRRLPLSHFASFAAIQLVGVVPLTLAMGRPETLLLHCIAAYVTWPIFFPVDSLEARWQRVASLVGFVFLTSTFFFSHPKSLYFAPLVIVSALATFASRRRPVLAAVVVGFSLLTIVQGFSAAQRMTRCDESPAVARTLARYTLSPSLLRTDPAAFVRKGIDNLHDQTVKVAESMTLQAPAPSHWLPDVPSTPLVEKANGATRFVLYALQIGAPILVLVSLFFVRDRRVRLRVLLAATLEIGLLGHLFTAIHHNFYMSGFMVGVPVVVAWLAVSAIRDVSTARLRRRLRPLILAAETLLQALAVFSAVVTGITLGPSLVRLARMDGSLIPDQPGSAPAFGAARERRRIRAQAERCGIQGDGSTNLVVDDVTLFAFDDLHRPFMIINSSDTNMWAGDFPGAKNLELLRGLGSPGIIARCAYFPSALVGRIDRRGDYCCAGTKDFELAQMPLGALVTFDTNGRGASFVSTGWTGTDESGRWTEGQFGEIVFASTPDTELKSIDFQMTASFFGPRQHQEVDVLLDDIKVGSVRILSHDNGPEVLRHVAVLPTARLRTSNRLTLRPSDVRSPRELGLNDDDRQLGIHLHALALNLPLTRVERGQHVTFGVGGLGATLVRSGWSWIEPRGRWTVGLAGELVFTTDDAMTRIHLRMMATLFGPRASEEVEVVLNGVALGKVILARGNADLDMDHELAIPPSALRLREQNILELRPSDVRSPKDIGLNGDERPLGVLLDELWLE